MSGMRHPSEEDLALLAGGETPRIRRFRLQRHVRSCEDCQEQVAAYRSLREDLSDGDLPGVNWNFLASEMRANIQVGLEAGACVRTSPTASGWVFANWQSIAPRIAVVLATLVLLVMSGFYIRDSRTRPVTSADPIDSTPILESTSTGVGIRIADKSFMLQSRSDATANQTMSARGDVEARVTDKGSVTINNVYLQ